MSIFNLRTVVAAGAISVGAVTASLAQQTELNILTFASPPTNGLKELSAQYEAETGIKINFDIVGQSVFENRIALAFTGGANDIDVIQVPAIQLNRWVDAGWLEPLTDKINALPDKDDFLPAALNTFDVGGDLYGLPFLAEAGMMAYRTDLLEAAGVEAPQTWEELVAVAAAIDSDETAGFAMRAAPGQGFNMFVFPMIMRAYGGKFFENYPNDLTVAINSPETLEALKLYIKVLNEFGPAGIGNFNYPEIGAGMQTGQVGMIVDGSSIAVQSVDAEKSQFADSITLALPPAGPEGRSPAIAVHGFGVPAGTENSDAAFDFVNWMTSTDTLAELAIATASPDFTRASVAENADVQAKYSAIQEDFLSLKIESLSAANTNYRPLLPYWPQMGTAIGEHINGAVNGLTTPEEALIAAAEEMQNYIDDNQ